MQAGYISEWSDFPLPALRLFHVLHCASLPIIHGKFIEFILEMEHAQFALAAIPFLLFTLLHFSHSGKPSTQAIRRIKLLFSMHWCTQSHQHSF